MAGPVYLDAEFGAPPKSRLGTPEVFAGRCKCGQIISVTVNELDDARGVSDWIGDMLEDCLTIEGMTIEKARQSFGCCTCGNS